MAFFALFRDFFSENSALFLDVFSPGNGARFENNRIFFENILVV